MGIKIKKATGTIEDFDREKLLNSLIRSGADRHDAEEVAARVVDRITPRMSTKKIYRLARKFLRQYNRVSVLRYSIKEALLRLGPSGYPFEKFIGELFIGRGYKVRVGDILQGKCVKHEVDVFAKNDREIVLVECKYRNNAEGAHDVKTALYVHSRHEDLRSVMGKKYAGLKISGWLVTNTRFTRDAIRFGRCSGMNILSWGYPKKNSLEKIIEKDKLYPVTVLSGLNYKQVHGLMEQGIFLMRDLAVLDVPGISSLLSITERRAASIKKQAEELCLC